MFTAILLPFPRTPIVLRTSHESEPAGLVTRTCSGRRPETTALYQAMQEHLATSEQWTEPSDGRSLPRFVTEEPL
jgi:hypothetical protein